MVTEKAYKEAKKIVDEYKQQEKTERHERIKKIDTELTDFFATNHVGGFEVHDFHLRPEAHQILVIVNYPNFGSTMVYVDEESGEKVREIGSKYGERLKFPYHYYPK